MSTQKNTAPIQKEGTVPLRRANGEERGHNPKGVAGPSLANEEERGPNPKGGTGLHKVME